MRKEIVYPNLPRGMGAVLGVFIRNSWMLQHKQPTIIGVRCGDKNIFDTFNDSTEVVTDPILKLALADYKIDMAKVMAAGERLGPDTAPIYRVKILKATDCFTTDELAPYVLIEDKQELIRSLYQTAANDFIMELYIRETGSVTSEDVNKSYLFEAGITAPQVVPVASSNRTTSTVTYTLESDDISDTLTVIYQGSEDDFADFVCTVCERDVELLKKVAE